MSSNPGGGGGNSNGGGSSSSSSSSSGLMNPIIGQISSRQRLSNNAALQGSAMPNTTGTNGINPSSPSGSSAVISTSTVMMPMSPSYPDTGGAGTMLHAATTMSSDYDKYCGKLKAPGGLMTGSPRTSLLDLIMCILTDRYNRLGRPLQCCLCALALVGHVSLGFIVYRRSQLSFVTMCCVSALIASLFTWFAFDVMCWLLRFPEGTARMNHISEAIREGSEGFFRVQYNWIAKISGCTGFLLFMCYALRSRSSLPEDIREFVSPVEFGILNCATFLVGACCSMLSGYAGIWVSVKANIRVASAARRNYDDALKICFRGGAVSSIVNVALAMGGLATLMLVIHATYPSIPVLRLPTLLVGYGFGASLVAMFAQLGGGIYTKAADVGADLVGKIEQGIPEDDARNPAVIADLVGDNVGDCAGQCADLFESMAAEILAAMILGGAFAAEAKFPPQVASGFVLFPLAVHSADLVISSLGMYFVRGPRQMHERDSSLLPPPTTTGAPPVVVDPAFAEAHDPMITMIKAYVIVCVAGLSSFVGLCRLLLYMESNPDVWKAFARCGVSGIFCALLFLLSTQYYTDYKYSRVKKIANLSETGPATNVIAGLSVGMESTALPVLTVGAAIVYSYNEGLRSGLLAHKPEMAGLFGTAMATMGMLSTSVFILSMSSFGPIADNAGGIVEMSGEPLAVRTTTDRLDAVGNVTKANTKGFSVGSAALASFLLFSAFLDEVEIFAKKPFSIVDITAPDVFAGGLLGGCLVFVFSAMALSAVGRTASSIVDEVRRQFQDPGIMTYERSPDYRICVSIVSEASLREMVMPGLLAVTAPIIVGIGFKILGVSRGNDLLGAEALGAFMMFATATGVLMALFLNNAGGAWDNAKKYIETGALGGKGSEAHKAAVVGDTVGDPCKDTAGPSVHVLIKLIATVTLVLTPLFASSA